MKKILILTGWLLSLICLSSCVSTKRMIYMQGLDSLTISQKTEQMEYELKIQPDDQLAISINTKNPELLQPFNSNFLIGSGSNANLSSSANVSQTNSSAGITYFQVDKNGYIHFPVLGDIMVKGKTRNEIASMFEGKLAEGNYLKDPSVTVKLMSFKVTVLGEVNNPGVQKLTNERLTILEAIGMAGDLLPSGRRENITVLREENGERRSYTVDLTNAQSVLQSPCYFLQQNDVVYVQPNSAIKVKGSATTTFLSLSATVVSMLASLVTLAVAVF